MPRESVREGKVIIGPIGGKWFDVRTMTKEDLEQALKEKVAESADSDDNK